MSGINLGGLTLVPGVYRFNSSAVLTGQLTLDAQGRGLAVAANTLDANQLDARGGPAVGDWTGGLAYDGNGALTAIPEPAAILWLTPLMALGVSLLRRLTNHLPAA